MKLLSTWPAAILLYVSTAFTTAQAKSDFKRSFESCKVNLVRTSTDSRITGHSFFDDNAPSSKTPGPAPEITLDTSLQLSCTLNAPVNAASVVFSSGSDSFTVPARVRPSKGKHSVRLDMPFSTRAPTRLLQLGQGADGEEISYTLYIASFDAATPQDQLVFPLGSFKWDPKVKAIAAAEVSKALDSTPSEWDISRFDVRPELSWTFGDIETGPGLSWGVVGTVFTLGLPVATLFALLPYILPQLNLQMISPAALGLLGGLALLEVLIMSYWLHFRIFTILPLLAVVAVPTALIGRTALREKAAQKQT